MRSNFFARPGQSQPLGQGHDLGQGQTYPPMTQMSTDEERNRFWTFKDWGENRRYLENKYLQSSCRSLSHHIYSVSLEGR